MARFKKGTSGNPDGRPKGATSLSPIIRQAFIDALDELESEGNSLSKILKQQLKKHPLQTLRAVSYFSPKEKQIEFESGAVDYIDILIAANKSIDERKEKTDNDANP